MKKERHRKAPLFCVSWIFVGKKFKNNLKIHNFNIFCKEGWNSLDIWGGLV